jgi:hypothetical protein
MAQTLTPTSDLYVGTWTTNTGGTTNLYAVLADVSDSTYTQSVQSPAGAPLVVALSDAVDPISSTGHTFTWRRRNPETGVLNMLVELRQGYISEGSQGTLIASWADNDIPDTFADASQTLSGAEADAITDYTALSLRFVATEA